jgi:hypothetical protein
MEVIGMATGRIVLYLAFQTTYLSADSDAAAREMFMTLSSACKTINSSFRQKTWMS